MIALHQPINSLDTIVDVTVRARLQSVAPDLDLIAVCGQANLAANRGRRFLAPAVVRAQRTKDVVETHYSRVQTKVLGVVAADALHVKLLPAVAIFGIGGISV